MNRLYLYFAWLLKNANKIYEYDTWRVHKMINTFQEIKMLSPASPDEEDVYEARKCIRNNSMYYTLPIWELALS